MYVVFIDNQKHSVLQPYATKEKTYSYFSFLGFYESAGRTENKEENL